jgi:hypothetical protein
LLSEKIVFPNQGLFVWLVADAGLFWEKSTADWLLVADLLWEKSAAGWWLISQANMLQLDWSSIWQTSRLIGTDTASCNEFLYVCARDWWTNNRTNTTSLPIILQINSWPLITKSTHLLASFPNHIFFGTTTNWSQGFPTNCSRQ